MSSSQLPDLSTQLPDLSTQLPDLSTQLPDLFAQLPDLSAQLPDLSAQLPDLSAQLPDLSARAGLSAPVKAGLYFKNRKGMEANGEAGGSDPIVSQDRQAQPFFNFGVSYSFFK